MVYAIYRRPERGRVFRLVTICLSQEAADGQAGDLARQQEQDGQKPDTYRVRSYESAADAPQDLRE